MRLDGINGIINIGSGSEVGHTAIVMKKDGKTYICESKSSLYFPRNNVMCNEWDIWMKWSYERDYNVIILPL